MAGSTAREPGFNGQLISLSGIRGKIGSGQRYRQELIELATTYAAEAIPANPLRTWMIIQNRIENTVPISVSFGDSTPAAASFSLQRGESLIIDRNNPWAGSFGFTHASGGTEYVRVAEFSIESQ